MHSTIGNTVHSMPLNSLDHSIYTPTMKNIRHDRDSGFLIEAFHFYISSFLLPLSSYFYNTNIAFNHAPFDMFFLAASCFVFNCLLSHN